MGVYTVVSKSESLTWHSLCLLVLCTCAGGTMWSSDEMLHALISCGAHTIYWQQVKFYLYVKLT